jgi:hypothetical protein
MKKSLNSSNSTQYCSVPQPQKHWLRLGAITTISILAGGFAIAWWYRKTVQSLHQNVDNEEQY